MSAESSTSDLERRFSFHPADTPERREAHERVRDLCKAVARQLDAQLPGGREKSLAITHLEETMFWANAAIARQEP